MGIERVSGREVVMEYWKEEEIRKAISQMTIPGQVFEVRITLKGKKTISGYFKEADTLIAELNNHNINYDGATIYLTLQKINEDCCGREQMNTFILGATTTSDNDITGYQWLFIDLDPRRPTGTSSTDEQLAKSRALADKVMVYMANKGWYRPVEAMSGNGWHLHYRVDLPNNQETKNLMAGCLKSLDGLFSNDDVAVDTAVFNPSRICKLYGTMAQKGKNTAERPHRLSYIKSEPFNPVVNDIGAVRRLAEELNDGVEQRAYPQKSNNYSTGDFDVKDFLEQHGVKIVKEQQWNGCTKYVLDQCVFDESHKAPDACVIVQANGAIGYKCLHNSCADKKWKDVRELLDPNYQQWSGEKREQDRRIEEGWRQHNREKSKEELSYELLNKEPDADGQFFYTAAEIRKMPKPNYEYVKTGTKVIDTMLGGLKKGGISVLTGLRASAKSTWISQVALNAINDGHRVIMYSGELSCQNVMEWMYRQAAGNNGLDENELLAGRFTVAEDTKDRITRWMNDKLIVYNNEKGSNFDIMAVELMKKIKEVKADLLVLDNLMTVDINTESRGYYDTIEKQTRFMLMLKNMARITNVHILLVAHPRKSAGFLRLQDVAGSSNITNIADAAFIMHRRNHDFEKGFKEEFKGTKILMGLETKGGFGNVLEIAKDRENGTQDEFIPLWFDPATKQLRDKPNAPRENNSIVFGWREL